MTNDSSNAEPQILPILFRLYLWHIAGVLSVLFFYYIFSAQEGLSLKRGIFLGIILALAAGLVIFSLLFHDIEGLERFLSSVIKKNFVVILVGLSSVLLLLFLLMFVSRPVFLFAINYIPKTVPILCTLVILVFITALFLAVYLRYRNKAIYLNYRNNLIGLIIILVQHFLIFKDHYLHNVGFPWDFPSDYYNYVVYWISLVTKGIIPNWAPHQEMGYPLAMNLQAGIHYPLFWLFPLLQITYTLNAAVIFQALHVLLGAIGMYVFLRALGNKPVYACIGAVAFQFFGGFYSNSEHADIVRAFSLIPWLLYSFTFSFRSLSIPKRILAIPLFIFLLATGGYPGNFIAGLAVLAVYSLIQLILLAVSSRSWQKVLLMGICLFSLTFLGVAMALFHLGPAFFERAYLYRYTNSISPDIIMGLSIQEFPSLFLTNSAVEGEISMTSMFITLPVLILACFISWKYVKRSIAVIAVGLFGVLMAGGPNSILWILLTKVFTPLSYSRFPISDYRIFFAIALIVLALGGLKSILERQLKIASTLLRTGVIIIGYLAGIIACLSFVPPSFQGFSGPLDIKEAVQSAIIFILTIGAIWVYFRVNHISPKALIILMGIFVIINGMQVLPTIEGWKEPNISNYDKLAFGYSFYDQSGNFKPYLISEQMSSKRPARISDQRWGPLVLSYVSGEFEIFGLPSNVFLLSNSNLIFDNQLDFAYMSLPWTPLLLPLDLSYGENAISLPDNMIQTAINNPAPPSAIVQDSYGINTIEYDINLKSPQLLIENEIYFPGWQADLIDNQGQKVIQSVPVNRIFRGWILPAGQYQMIANFSFPFQNLYISISALAIFFWFIVSMNFRLLNTAWSKYQIE